MLTMTALNALLADRYRPDGQMEFAGPSSQSASLFAVGYAWGNRVWLVIIGVGLGLLSHGLQEAQVHLFDWWCSRRARSDAGLDYGRYLNSQPRAPVAYGVQGFLAFASLRYLLVVGNIAASILYKFGVFEPDVTWSETLEAGTLSLASNCPEQIMSGQDEVSPWFMRSTRSFPGEDLYEQVDASTLEPYEPPGTLTFVGEGCCSNGRVYDSGHIFSREVVVVATRTEVKGNFTMTRAGDDDWHRVYTVGSSWFDDTSDRAVVEYRAPAPGQVQIQWAKFGPWATDEAESSSDRAPVVRQVVYDMHYAVAEVMRYFGSMLMCGTVSGLPVILSKGRGVFPSDGGYSNESVSRFVDANRIWIDAQVAGINVGVQDGVQAILRPFMYKWASPISDEVTARGTDCAYDSWSPEARLGEGGEFVRLLASQERPFGNENDTWPPLREWARQLHHRLEHPYFVGTRGSGVTACDHAAAGCFLALGLVALAITALRLYIGPAELTSWTGQHIYLSQSGAISAALERRHDLASGYQVAPVGLGRLHLGLDTASNSDG